MINCPKCKKEINDTAKFCNYCREKILQSRKQTNDHGGVDKYFANQKNALIDLAKAAAHKEAVKGILWFVGAMVITFITYSAASDGGTYFVFWGAMIYGIYRLLRGLYYKFNPKALLNKVEAAQQEANPQEQKKKK